MRSAPFQAIPSSPRCSRFPRGVRRVPTPPGRHSSRPPTPLRKFRIAGLHRIPILLHQYELVINFRNDNGEIGFLDYTVNAVRAIWPLDLIFAERQPPVLIGNARRKRLYAHASTMMPSEVKSDGPSATDSPSPALLRPGRSQSASLPGWEHAETEATRPPRQPPGSANSAPHVCREHQRCDRAKE